MYHYGETLELFHCIICIILYYFVLLLYYIKTCDWPKLHFADSNLIEKVIVKEKRGKKCCKNKTTNCCIYWWLKYLNYSFKFLNKLFWLKPIYPPLLNNKSNENLYTSIFIMSLVIITYMFEL